MDLYTASVHRFLVSLQAASDDAEDALEIRPRVLESVDQIVELLAVGDVDILMAAVNEDHDEGVEGRDVDRCRAPVAP